MATDTLEVFGTEYTGVTGIKATDDNGQTKTYIRPQGTLSISANATGIDCSRYAEVDVAVPAPSPTIESLTVTPSTSQQTFNASGVDGYKPVTVNAMPSGSATAPASISGTAATVTAGTNTLTLTKTVSITPSVTAGYVASGTAGNSSVSLTANITTKAAATITPGTTNQTIASGTYLTGTQTIQGDSNLVPANIAQGVSIFGVQGTHSGGGSSKNIQVYRGYDTSSATSYTATDVTLTVAKTGTYNVSWMGYRNTTSGTNGSQLYVNGTARGNAQTTFVNSYGQSVSLTNQSFNQGDVLVVRARARSTSYVVGVGNLIIEEV